ncbi:MAG: NAD-dependent epimerase/dehydratase family protein [Candidatus Methylacidiphilales bacterium]
MSAQSSRRVVVTGSSGKMGRACVADLLAHGYDVYSVDSVQPAVPGARQASIIADLTDFGQTIDAISACDSGQTRVHAVVHLAAIPAPRKKPNAALFSNNTLSDYNVFESCKRLGIKHVVYASSETVLGLPFDTPPPYVPVDEEYAPRPESAYSLSKVLSETMAQQLCRWDPELKMFGLRLSNIMEPRDYEAFPTHQSDPMRRKWNLWGYIDARDAAQAIRLSIESPLKGAEVFIIANSDTVMLRSSQELLAEVFPGVPIRGSLTTHQTLLSNEKAKRMLGFAPQFSWRDHTGLPSPEERKDGSPAAGVAGSSRRMEL